MKFNPHAVRPDQLHDRLADIGMYEPGDEIIARRSRKNGVLISTEWSHPAVVGAVFSPCEHLVRKVPAERLLQMFTLIPAGNDVFKLDAFTMMESDLKLGGVGGGDPKFAQTYNKIKEAVVDEFNRAPIPLATLMVESLKNSHLDPRNKYHRKHGCHYTVDTAFKALTALTEGDPLIVSPALVQSTHEAIQSIKPAPSAAKMDNTLHNMVMQLAATPEGELSQEQLLRRNILAQALDDIRDSEARANLNQAKPRGTRPGE